MYSLVVHGGRRRDGGRGGGTMGLTGDGLGRHHGGRFCSCGSIEGIVLTKFTPVVGELINGAVVAEVVVTEMAKH